MRHILISVLLILALPMAAAADRKLGLVIGNDTYSDVPRLDKARADAVAISDSLRQQGFEIITAVDATRREMNRKISEFTGQLEPGDTAFVFFAGHGVEIDGENYLLPTDIIAPSSGETDFVKSESIALSGLLDRVRATGARTTVAIIDACRNNPFETTTGRSIGGTRGLGRIAAPQGTFVIFSAGAGQLALDELTEDDPAKNSVFTRALLPRLSEQGLELRAMIASLRVEVRDLARTVNHQQFPAYYDELLGDFYFSAAAPATQSVAPQKVAAAPLSDPMRADFDLARSLGTPEALQSFLDRYSDRSDEFSFGIARQLLDEQTVQTRTPIPDTSTDQPAPKPPVVAASAGLPLDRDVIRATQQALNDARCSAGGADGVIGPRTRRAFGRFIADNDAPLMPDDLGTERALRVIKAAGADACKTVVAAPDTSTPASASSPSGVGLTLAGKWSYKASCLLLVKVTGSANYSQAGPSFYHGRLSDSLGQKANSEVYLNGRNIAGTDYFPGIVVKWQGRLAADGNSFTASGSTGCSVYAWRTG